MRRCGAVQERPDEGHDRSRGTITLRTARRRRREASCTADSRRTSRRATAAAHARRARPSTPTGSSSRARRRRSRLRRAGAAQLARRRSPLARRRRQRAAAGVGTRMVEELRAARTRAKATRSSARSRTRPASSSSMGFSIVPHLWCPRKSFTDCVSCPLFRQLRPVRDGPAARRVDAERATAPRDAGRARTAIACRRRSRRIGRGGVTTPNGFRAAGVTRHQGQRQRSIWR